jgi:integrase/recombinase XerD
MSEFLLDRAGRRRSPATLPGFHAGQAPGKRVCATRDLGHSNLGTTSAYLQGIDSGEIIETVHARRAPMIPVSASLRL